MGVHGCAPICPFFYEKKYFSTRLAFCMLRTSKKAAKGTRACLRSSSSALATVIQLSTPHRGRFWRCLVSLCSGAVRCTQPTDPPQVVFYAQGYCPGLPDHRHSDSPYTPDYLRPLELPVHIGSSTNTWGPLKPSQMWNFDVVQARLKLNSFCPQQAQLQIRVRCRP